MRSYKYRISPDKDQIHLIEQHFNCCRFIYNLALETKIVAYSGTKYNIPKRDLQKQLVSLKDECKWLRDINSQSLQSQILNLDTAYINFFKGYSGFPKFKSKRGRQSFQCPQSVIIDFEKSLLHLPKFKSDIPIKLHRTFKGTIKTVTISKNLTGRYFASILVDTGIIIPKKTIPTKEGAIGIDVGINSFATVCNIDLTRSLKINNPKYLSVNKDMLSLRHRQFSKKKINSKNKEKARYRLARLNEKISNQRNDFINKVSYRLVNDNQVNTICIEDLNVAGMMFNHTLARSISDTAWGEFFRQLKYKCDWSGKNILKAERFSATSKTCHVCGYRNNFLTLSNRKWDCPICKTHHDRDENAVPNIISSAFLKYNKNRDGLPELTLGESLPLSSLITTKRKARSKNQEKFLYNKGSQ